MNIDERIEALTQSVEWMASCHRDNEERMKQLAEIQTAHSVELSEIRTTLAQTSILLLKATNTLRDHAERIAERDERMDRIERHLEVLIGVVDGVIRDGGKKKGRK